MTRRQDRVGDLIRQELSQILLRDLKDPRVQLASISRVDLSADLRNAHISVSILGNDEEREEAISALKKARGFLRGRLAASARSLRSIPELFFELDRGAEYSQHISDLLEQLDEPDAGS